MAEIATYAQLRAWGSHPEAATILEKGFGLTGKNVFLSHTTADDDLVAGVVLLLHKHGASVYVDHQDPSVAGADCVAIAEHLRKVMSQCSRLVMLASPKSKDSKWIPWELGLADGLERQRNVALFPSAESSSDLSWSEREYLSLYRRIVWAHFEGRSIYQWMVWDHIKNVGEPLSDWLSRT
jgi:hypothetical protein